MRPSPFELFAKYVRIPSSRRTVLASLGVGAFVFRSGNREIVTAQTCVPRPICGPQQRCHEVDCASCANEDAYDRFLLCARNRDFCGGRGISCCAFCAEWAGGCDCCSG